LDPKLEVNDDCKGKVARILASGRSALEQFTKVWKDRDPWMSLLTLPVLQAILPHIIA